MASSDGYNYAKLRELLTRLSREELKRFVFDLDVDYEVVVRANLTKDANVIDIVRYFRDKDRIDELINVVKEVFPDLNWGEVVAGKTSLNISPDSSDIHNPLILEAPFRQELIHISAGHFLMGSNPEEDLLSELNERPQQKIFLPDYYIGKYPVTNHAWAIYARENKIKFSFDKRDAHRPVVMINWHEASAFCLWLQNITGKLFALPSEAQWEKAARGLNGRIYPWGKVFDRKVKSPLRLFFEPRVVRFIGSGASKNSSYSGVCDLVDCVGQWCSNYFFEKYSQEGFSDDANTSFTRAVRGQSYFREKESRCAARRGLPPNNRYVNVGFRVAMNSIP